MIRELYEFEGELFCSEHGEYTEHEQDLVGIEMGCPICFTLDEESDRAESAC